MRQLLLGALLHKRVRGARSEKVNLLATLKVSVATLLLVTVLLSVQKRIRIVTVVLEADSGGMLFIIVRIGQAWRFIPLSCGIQHRLALDRV